MKADATLEQQLFRGKECCGRRCAQSGVWWGVRCRRSTPVLKRPWWRVWGAALDSRVRGDRSERCREKHLRQCGQGTLWRRQRGQWQGRASGGRAPCEGRRGGARDPRQRLRGAQVCLGAVWPKTNPARERLERASI